MFRSMYRLWVSLRGECRFLSGIGLYVGAKYLNAFRFPNIARKMYSVTDWTLSTLQDWKSLGVLYSTQSPPTARRACCKIELG